jgi:hypothetical protein
MYCRAATSRLQCRIFAYDALISLVLLVSMYAPYPRYEYTEKVHYATTICAQTPYGTSSTVTRQNETEWPTVEAQAWSSKMRQPLLTTC